MIRKLKYEELLYGAELTEPENSTSNFAIGQERAVEAIRFGLGIDKSGYNILVVGSPGSGRTYFAEKIAGEVGSKMQTPDDLCYVYNFKNPKEPQLLNFPAGQGSVFRNEISELIHTLSVELPKAYNTDQYESEKEVLLKEIQTKRDEAVKSISDRAREQGFSVKNDGGGLTFKPIVDGRILTDEEYEGLTGEERESFNKKSELIMESADEYIKNVREAENTIRKEIYEIDYNVGLFTIGRYFSPLQEKYCDNAKASEYIMCLKEDILANLDIFTETENDESEDFMSTIMPWAYKKNNGEALRKYEVNLFTDNKDVCGVPVICSYSPTYSGLVGEIEFDNEFGNYTTDFTKIMPGLFHKANGGILILQLYDVISSPFVWDTLKKVLKTGEIEIEPIKDLQFSGISITTLKPEPVKFKGKIVLVCSDYYYDIIREYDDDTDKLFKITAFFDYEMKSSDENIGRLLSYIKEFPERNNTREFTSAAAAELIKFSKRTAGRRDRLTGVFSKLNDVLTEANGWAELDGAERVDIGHIRKAIDKAHERTAFYENKLDEMYKEGDMLIDTEGEKVGQINGLSVMEAYGAVFGRPSRITAATYMGEAGVVNIEKESRLSGSIHTKGVNVICGYLGRTYAKKFPLSFSARICFEQNYGGIDGDSASAAEVIAILSGLSDMPIRQDIAITGSINQFGEIQPIGGVTHKTEGFYEVCRKKGLNGSQGVIIPMQNVKELVLKDEVIEAVKDGSFSIYAVENIDESMEILMGRSAGEIHSRVYRQLERYSKNANK